MNLAIFYLFAVIAAVSALLVVTLKNIFHSALFLVLTLFSVAGLYVLLDAGFLAGVQVLIYVGAITILMIFAIMLTYQLTNKNIRQTNEQKVPATIIVLTMIKTAWPLTRSELPSNNILELGRQLLQTYVVPFEVVSIVLLVALIGAIIISRREPQEDNQ